MGKRETDEQRVDLEPGEQEPGLAQGAAPRDLPAQGHGQAGLCDRQQALRSDDEEKDVEESDHVGTPGHVHYDQQHEQPFHVTQPRHQASLDECGRRKDRQKSHEHHQNDREEEGRCPNALARDPLVPHPQNRVQHHVEIDWQNVVVEDPRDMFRGDDGEDHEERIEAPHGSDQQRRDEKSCRDDGERPDPIRREQRQRQGQACDEHSGRPSPVPRGLQCQRL